ncbi:sugar phosphate isomerase/epimerase family protein [Anaerobium acetethylicum]|uniref:Sugar phosphate isomerase/epimerase n=1 Tax=Anaerobium acetethylicum TaxID=1619234 RepID=A0A1D3TWG4_9FIRM|nr:TIM barrel protein [Anaerobium acetethylicum]SCP98551.1 Sugar phosphate isomerase/epimerase [Anaerobium acetethylicum]
MNYNIKRSVSLYSYQEEYYLGKLDLEGCIREAAKAGATGIELLAEQMMPNFPYVTPEFKEQWFGWMDKYGTEPTCYDAFLENKIYDNRTLTLREQVRMMERDIKIAGELGFKTLRTLCSTPMDVIKGSLDCAAKEDVKICIEVHSPFSLNSGWADGYMDMILGTGTKHFGFMPDFGIFCKKIPDVLTAKALRQGASPECVKIVNDAFANRVEKGFTKIKYDTNLGRAHGEYVKANGMPELMEAIEKAGGNAADMNYARASFNYTWCDPQDIIDNIQYIYHTHAKCYNTNAEYEETSIPLKEVIAAYKKAGYTGYLSTEYEGNSLLNDAFEVDSIEQVRRHQEAMRRAIED